MTTNAHCGMHQNVIKTQCINMKRLKLYFIMGQFYDIVTSIPGIHRDFKDLGTTAISNNLS
jgi:hypothetical protein